MTPEKIEFMRRAGFTEDELPSLDSPGMTDQERNQQVRAWFVERDGPPTIEDYRKTYRLFRIEWPGDDEVRRMYPILATTDGAS